MRRAARHAWSKRSSKVVDRPPIDRSLSLPCFYVDELLPFVYLYNLRCFVHLIPSLEEITPLHWLRCPLRPLWCRQAASILPPGRLLPSQKLYGTASAHASSAFWPLPLVSKFNDSLPSLNILATEQRNDGLTLAMFPSRASCKVQKPGDVFCPKEQENVRERITMKVAEVTRPSFEADDHAC